MEKKKLGALGEKIATSLLKSKGYKILTKNFQTRIGEIDIIAVDSDVLVFAEVKTRYSRKFGLPEEHVHLRKLKTIEKVGQYFRLKYPDSLPEAERIDVVAIELDENNKPTRKEVIKNASG